MVIQNDHAQPKPRSRRRIDQKTPAAVPGTRRSLTPPPLPPMPREPRDFLVIVHGICGTSQPLPDRQTSTRTLARDAHRLSA